MDNLANDLHVFLTAFNIDVLYNKLRLIATPLLNGNLAENITAAATSFTLIAAAEMGDKSQLVCMTLASRHRATPILLGAIAAFAFLNSLAVVFGLAIANYLPKYLVAAIVAGLFALFGLHAFRAEAENAEAAIQEKRGHAIFFTTFALITVAEFGDKTQLAVVALSSTASPLAVWMGSTLALATASALGILAGRTLLQKIPLTLLHKISGAIFLILAFIAANRAYLSYTNL
jgi:Ca2+/H+ antiporter, TMEM165/GDT1 family